jgi:uncharacterized membrane protein
MAFAPDESSTGMPPAQAAGLAAVLTVFGGMYFAVVEKKSKFVKLYAAQSIRIFGVAFFGGIFLLLSKAMGFLSSDNPLAMVFEAVSALLYLAFFIMYLALSINAFGGKVCVLPVFGAGLKKKLGIEE